jgi:hypothetical protein
MTLFCSTLKLPAASSEEYARCFGSNKCTIYGRATKTRKKLVRNIMIDYKEIQ